MLGRSDILIFVLPELIARAQVKGGRITSWQSQRRNPADDLVTAVEMALDLEDGTRGRTWIVTADVWSQPVTVDGAIARRVPRDRLSQFLCFEVEPLSGISARSGQAGVADLGGSKTEANYWVTEIDRTILDQIEGLVQSRGGRLGGMFHAAAPSVPLAPNLAQGTSWWRIELWPDFVGFISGQAGKGVSRQIVPRSAAGDEWQSQVKSWFEQQSGSSTGEFWSLSGESPLLPGFARPELMLSAQEPAQTRQWADAWAAAIARSPGVPTIVPARKPLTQQSKRMLTAGLAAATLLGCVGHYQLSKWLNARATATMQEQIATFAGPTAQAKAARDEIAKATKDADDLSKKHAALIGEMDRFRAASSHQKQRMLRLLETLSVACSPNVVIHSIEGDRNQMRLFGRCINGLEANDVAQSLAYELSKIGLLVSTPDKEAQQWFRDGKPHEFELTISDSLSASSANPFPVQP